MRRALLALLLGTSAAAGAQAPAVPEEVAAVFAAASVSLSVVRIEAPGAATMPLVDAHNHLNANVPAELLIPLMNRAGVEAMVLMPRHYRAAHEGGGATDEQALDYARRYPGRFVPFVGGQRDDLGSRAIQDPSNVHFVLEEFDGKLATGGYRGLGEFILVHHAYDVSGGETGGEVRIRVDHRAMRGAAALAGKHKVPMLFHAEAEEAPAQEAEALLAAFPGTQFIWAHNCGRASAEDTARRLRQFPNLTCDLGHMFHGPLTSGGYGAGWPRKTPWVHLVQDVMGVVLPDMKRLFDAFPDRFLIGTDTAHTHYFLFYEYRIAIFRVLLAQLSPEAARKIGAENARRLFGLPAPRP